jgi:hypothetical protein
MRSKVRAYSHQGHGPRADQQAGYISATSASTPSLAKCSRSIHWVRNCHSTPTSPMSASLIGGLGSSTFRLSTMAVLISLTGSRFSSESAPRPFQHGVRGGSGTIFATALPFDERQVQADIRSHFIHRPVRDIFPPPGGVRVFSYRIDSLGFHAAVTSRVQRNSVPSTHMRCMITANRRASATMAFFSPRCLAIFIAQALSQDHFVERTSTIWAAS